MYTKCFLTSTLAVYGITAIRILGPEFDSDSEDMSAPSLWPQNSNDYSSNPDSNYKPSKDHVKPPKATPPAHVDSSIEQYDSMKRAQLTRSECERVCAGCAATIEHVFEAIQHQHISKALASSTPHF